jgi:uncharacterized protein YaeQ
VALPATLRRFTIALADADRDLYTELDWRVAQHPSESERYLVARVIARVLEHRDDLDFSKGGVSDDVEPAIIGRDLRGDLTAWIEVGSPTLDRLHKASKLGGRVAVYTWKTSQELVDAIRERDVHRGDEIIVTALDPDVLDAVATTLDRINKWDLSVTGGTLYLTVGDIGFEMTPERLNA